MRGPRLHSSCCGRWHGRRNLFHVRPQFYFVLKTWGRRSTGYTSYIRGASSQVILWSQLSLSRIAEGLLRCPLAARDCALELRRRFPMMLLCSFPFTAHGSSAGRHEIERKTYGGPLHLRRALLLRSAAEFLSRCGGQTRLPSVTKINFNPPTAQKHLYRSSRKTEVPISGLIFLTST